MKFRDIIKFALRKIGLLSSIRGLLFRFQYRKLLSKWDRKPELNLEFRGTNVVFSLKDPFSRAFFGYYFEKGLYELRALETIVDILPEEGVFFDVGSNIGYFSCIVGQVRPRVRVHAFELGRENAKIMNRNVGLNGLANVIVNLVAVSDRAGMTKVVDSPVGNAVLRIMDVQSDDNDDFVDVPTIDLSSYCLATGDWPNLVKVDVEGAEMKVLKGMTELFARPIKLLIELHRRELVGFGSSLEEVLDFLARYGFTIQFIENDDRKNPLILASNL